MNTVGALEIGFVLLNCYCCFGKAAFSFSGQHFFYLLTGKKIIVKETREEVTDLVISYKRAIYNSDL